MKLSIAWIFDHIQVDWKTQDIPALMAKLGSTTAEIDAVRDVSTNFDMFSLAQVMVVSPDSVVLFSAEWKKEFNIPGARQAIVGQWYVVVKEKKEYRFATLADFGSEKEGFFPAVSCTSGEELGAWKKQCEIADYIISLDNKAITHRPDLWGHRGFAREIAALLDIPLRAEDIFLAAKPIKHYETAAQVKIETAACKRLAAMHVQSIDYTASRIHIAIRLARIDARPIDFIVDATNYVMYDWGQPMHAFDAASVDNGVLIAQQARAGEKLTLLDGETITLTPEDTIISDGHKALALAGIMGGSASGVNLATRDLIVESANFDATAIRRTAARYKKRTEASSRFEKNLDPHQNTYALLRFLKILDTEKISYIAGTIVSLGALKSEPIITVLHDFIQKKLGVVVDFEDVIAVLKRLGFGVQYDKKNGIYTIIVPSYRATKDISIAEDIVEEVGRFIGYNTIPAQDPVRAMKPFDISALMRMRALKRQCAYGLHMHEVYNYAFYDEEFIKKIGLTFITTEIVNPVSENWKRLITSLVPHLLKNISMVVAGVKKVSFFEVGRVWKTTDTLEEKEQFAAVMYNKNGIDFYEGKAQMQTLFDALGLTIIWRKSNSVAPWFDAHQTAEIVYQGIVIGYAGKIAPTLAPRIADGDIFIAELSVKELIAKKQERVIFKQLAKYQPVDLDISMLVPYTITTETLLNEIMGADKRIHETYVVDFFEKREWATARSLTVRFIIIDDTKTLTKEEIDMVHARVAAVVKKLGVEVR